MKKIAIILSLFSVLLTTNSYASNDEPKAETQQDKTETTNEGQVFKDVKDRSTNLNQNTTDAQTGTISAPFNQSSFVPDISLILDSTYVYRSLENETFKGLTSPGFAGVEDYQKNGFNLNYAELSIGSTVDPYFDLMAVFPFTPQGVAIEEAFINTRSLPANFQFKAGKFRSFWGRLNSMHEHSWDFNDPPVVYTAFFGSEQLNEAGIQVTWLAPTDFYLLLGAEGLQGTNEKSFGTTGFELNRTKVSGTNIPNLLVTYAKTSVDIGENFTILGGLSFAAGGSKTFDAAADPKNATGFSGNSRVYGADLTLKYYLDSYRYLSLQSEYMYRSANGQNFTSASSSNIDNEQSGFYSQLLWRFDQLWRTGVRFDLLNRNDNFADGKLTSNPGNLARYSAMVEVNPTEFSRFRLQYNFNNYLFADTTLQPVHEVFLQMNIAVGAHGAHAF
jgi:hypothetical protein